MLETALVARAQPSTLPRASATDAPLRRELRVMPRLRRLRAMFLRGATARATCCDARCC